MAENENGQEKTELPTPKRLKDAREKGDSPRSPELATAAVFLSAVLALILFGGWMGRRSLSWMRLHLEQAGQARGLGEGLIERGALIGGELLLAVLPWKYSRTSSWLLLPYLLWVAFAAYLNWTIVRLNAPF